MPISRQEFERGQIDLTGSILDILAEDSDLAWSFKELHNEVQRQIGTPVPENAFRPALASLEADGSVESREVWELTYYILRQPGEDESSV